MSLELLNKILVYGEQIDVYSDKTKIYLKILYDNEVYIISKDNRGIIRLEQI